MSDRLTDRVAFIGEPPAMGPAHAVRWPPRGADIIAVDVICGPLPTCVPYNPASKEDLDETVPAWSNPPAGTHPCPDVVNTRDATRLTEAVDTAVTELGRLDIIVANAGITAPSPGTRSLSGTSRRAGHQRDRRGTR